MQPQRHIEALDRQIAEHGQTIKLRRGATPSVDVRAFVRGFKSDEIVGLVSQADRKVVLSASTLGFYGIPRHQDDVLISGQLGKVQADIEPIYIDDTLVRVNLRARIA